MKSKILLLNLQVIWTIFENLTTALGSVLVERIYNFHLLYIFSLESGLSIGSSSNARATIKKTRLQSDACKLFRSQQIIGRTFQIERLFKVKIWRGTKKLNIVLKFLWRIYILTINTKELRRTFVLVLPIIWGLLTLAL